MSTESLSALLAAIVTFAIGLSVLLRDRPRRPYIAFAVLCFNLCLWYLLSFLARALKSDAVFWTSLLFAAAVPVNAQRFFGTFLAEDPRGAISVNRWVLLGTGLFYLLLLYAGLFHPIHRSRLFTVPLLLFVFGSLYYCVYLIHMRKSTTPSRTEATRLTYLLYGGLATVTLAASDFVPRDWVTFPTIGNVLAVVYMYFISQTLFHYRLLDIKELLGKMVNLSALVLLLTVIYGLLLAWVGRDQPGVFFFNTVVASFVILVIFEQLKTRVEDRVNRWMFREKYEFSRRLLLLRQELANIIEERSLVSRILRELEDSERATHASIYLPDLPGTSFRLAGHVGPAPVELLEGSTRRLFLERLRESGLLTQEALERDLETHSAEGPDEAAEATRHLLATMEDLRAGVCIQLVFENQMLGILNLRDDRLREAYAWDELDELRKVAAQAAITLRNSKVYEQMKERDRLAALGQMAAGLAHEIRNPLGAIKGAAQLLKSQPPARAAGVAATSADTSDTSPWGGSSGGSQEAAAAPGEPAVAARGELPAQEAEDEEYLDIIVEEVNRLDRVVSQFLGYARPDRGERQSLNINDVVHRSLQLLTSQANGIAIRSDLSPDLPQIRADAEQLRQVFLNLGINALQAMETGGALRVSTRLHGGYRRGAGPVVEIAFHDGGRGIPTEALSDIFIPFFTTKEHGTGLGLPICQRIIENHGGSIEVRSIFGKGSTFSVFLPAIDGVTATQPGTVPRPGSATSRTGGRTG